MKDIEDEQDIVLMVQLFYGKVREDDLLGPIFALRISKDAWNVHLNRMQQFWATVLFAKGGYKGNPFAKHSQLPVRQQHFDRWLQLFRSTISENFRGTIADKAKAKAELMAKLFHLKLQLNQDQDQNTTIV